MTWEIAVGIITVMSAFCSVISVVLKVNRTLVSLEDAVKQLRVFMERQDGENRDFHKMIGNHEQRLRHLEGRMPDCDSGCPD